MSRYDHKIETSLEGIEHLSKEKKEEKEIKMKEKNPWEQKEKDQPYIGSGITFLSFAMFFLYFYFWVLLPKGMKEM